MEWSCNTGECGALFVSFFGLAGLQDSGMCAATGNDRDCRQAIALGFLYLNQSPGYQETADFDKTFSLRIHLVERQSLSP